MNYKLYNWIWKWHFIGGLVSLPIVILLSVTGIIYLFKDSYELKEKAVHKKVEVLGTRLSFQEQWDMVKESAKPSAVILPQVEEEATEFVSGRFSNKSSVFVNPYNGSITGNYQLNKTNLFKVRKLHGELLLGKFGTKVVELVASWIVVLIITGVYLFWPRERGWKGLFTVRFNVSKRILYRDLHAVSGFWFSAILLLILAGGLPWTDVWGTGYKWVRELTDSGITKEWKGRGLKSDAKGRSISLDRMLIKAKALNLDGEVSIGLPKSSEGVYSVSNKTSNLEMTQKYHFDQYSGVELYHGTWKDIGVMRRTRLWVMAFHQGQFGFWNWLLVLFTAIALVFMSVTALLSYLKRKKKGEWSVPEVPVSFVVGKGLLLLLVLLALFLPMFGISLVFIYFVEKLRRKKFSNS